jgi:hypothetical protein
VFTAEECQTVAFLNQEVHLRLRCSRDGSDLRGAFARLCEVERSVREALQADSVQFAESDRLGHLTTSPSSLGTALHAEVFVRLQMLPKRPKFKELCQRCKVTARASGEGGPGLMCVWNSQTLGSTEADQINDVIQAVRHFVSLEAQLTRGLEVDLEGPLPELEIEVLRARSKSTFSLASQDGRLESALQTLLPQDQQGADEASAEETRERAKAALVGALDDGRLGSAIEGAISSNDAGQQDNTVGAVKERARMALTDAAESGDLDRILQDMLPG